MISNERSRRSIWRKMSMAVIAGGISVMAASAAQAGSCPASQMGIDVTKPGPMEPKGVTDTVLANTDLSKEMVALGDHQFRLRRLEVQPGGIVPWHAHGDRPAMIYVVSGTMVEHASNCAVPIVHKAGDVAPETHVTSHWWENTGKKKAVLISVDILHDATDMNM
ncbi:cupin domain-containing protein [Dongia sp.]|uniref:cupin domain-containing protein n=1 Tax=Dongia sp. TaxID=1977262 RepID=UPI0035B070D9